MTTKSLNVNIMEPEMTVNVKNNAKPTVAGTCLACETSVDDVSAAFHIVHTHIPEIEGPVAMSLYDVIRKFVTFSLQPTVDIVCLRCYRLLADYEAAEKSYFHLKKELTTLLAPVRLKYGKNGDEPRTDTKEVTAAVSQADESSDFILSAEPLVEANYSEESDQKDDSDSDYEPAKDSGRPVKMNVKRGGPGRPRRGTGRRGRPPGRSGLPRGVQRGSGFLSRKRGRRISGRITRAKSIRLKDDKQDSEEHNNLEGSDNSDFEWKMEEDDVVFGQKRHKPQPSERPKEDDNDSNDATSCESPDEKIHLRKQRSPRKSMKNYDCGSCSKSYRTPSELETHKLQHSGEKPFICEICGQAYKHRLALEIHVEIHRGEHRFQCHICNKVFTQKCGLQRHLPMHTGECPYQCDICGKRFLFHSSFSIHKLTHSGEKPYKCDLCGAAFMSASHLKRHLRVHSGEKPHRCQICLKAFAEKYNLEAHVRIHTGNKLHRCPTCGAGFDRRIRYEEHLATHGPQSSESQNIEEAEIPQLTQPQQQQNMMPMPPSNVPQPQQCLYSFESPLIPHTHSQPIHPQHWMSGFGIKSMVPPPPSKLGL